jgi:hypothetical protein
MGTVYLIGPELAQNWPRIGVQLSAALNARGLGGKVLVLQVQCYKQRLYIANNLSQCRSADSS